MPLYNTPQLQNLGTSMPLPAAGIALPAIATGLTALSGFLTGKDNKAMTAQQLAEQRRQFDASSRQRGAETALNATQMDPLAQQRSRQKQALMEQLMKGASSPTLNVGAGTFEGGMKFGPEMFAQIASYFTPEARAAAEGQFGTAAGAASGGVYGTPNLSAMGYGTAAAPTTGMPSPMAMPRNPYGPNPTDARQRSY